MATAKRRTAKGPIAHAAGGNPGESPQYIAPSEEAIEERPGTRIRALLARTRPLSGNEVPEVYWDGRALVESLALSYDVSSVYSWSPSQCATVLEFLSTIEPTAGSCFCNDQSEVNATCGFHVILDFMADELRKQPGGDR